MTSQVVVQFIGNAASFVGATQQVETSAGKLQTKLTPLGKGLAAGLGFGFATSAAGLFTTAVSKVTDFVGDSVAAFNEEQRSIQQLGTSLKANIPAWDGNTDAIERVFKAQMALGFSDDEQRSSMSLLVAATHDVAEAQRVQAVAMDLARFKGISLAEASQALTSIEAGRARGLALLGINTKDYSTTAERLAAVEKVVGGAAEDFATTNEGKLLVSQVKVNEAMEKFGKSIAPLQVTVMSELADRTTDLANVLTVLQDGVAKTTDAQEEQLQSGLDLAKAVAFIIPPMGMLADAEQDMLDKTTAAREGQELLDQTYRGGWLPTLTAATKATDTSNAALIGLGTSAYTAAHKIGDATHLIGLSWDEVRDRIKADARSMITDAFDPIIAKDNLAADNARAAADRKIIASHDATKAGKEAARQAQVDLDSTMQATAEALVTLAQAGETSSGTFKAGLRSLETYAATVKGPAHDAIMALIVDIKKLRDTPATLAVKITVPNIKVIPSTTGGLPHIVQDYANSYVFRQTGGPVGAGMPYIVGEKGPEWFVPRSSGTVLPHGRTPATGTTIHVNYAPMISTGSPAEMDAAARALGPAIVRELRHRGLIPQGSF